MMANMPIFADLAASMLTGTAKPGVAIEGEGIDFSALLANIQPGTGDVPVQGVSAAVTPPAVVEQTISTESAPQGAPPDRPAALPTVQVETATNNAPLIVADASKKEAPATNKEKTVRIAVPAKFTQTTSVLPQLAMAITPPDAFNADTPTADVDVAEGGDDLVVDTVDMPVKPAFAEGLAMPLLEGLDIPISGGEIEAPELPVPHAAAQVAALPANAALPAQIQAQARIQAFTAPATLPQNVKATGLDNAAVQSSGRVQAMALRQITEFPADRVMAHAASKADSGVDGVTASTPASASAPAPAPALSGTIAPLPVSPVALAAPMDIAAPPLAMAAVTDTAAMLGDQVIDMGVEGQWIDRMAREIADISAGTGRASFSLNPENLGRLQVEILQGDDGANVRLTAETDAAATALNQGRHQLQQDARLQAVRINDVQVERGNESSFSTRGQSMGQDQAGNQGQSQAFHKKTVIEAVSNMTNRQDRESVAAAHMPSQRALYA